MKNSASYNNLKQPSEDPPSHPKLKRAVTYSHYKDSEGKFFIIDIRQEDNRPALYISPVSSSSSLSTLFPSLVRSLSDGSDISSPPSSSIKIVPNLDQDSTEEEEDVTVINYPSISSGDILNQIRAQHLESMRSDHKLMGWDDSF